MPRVIRERLLYFVGVALFVLGTDQLTKFLVRTSMEVGESIPENGLLRITFVRNTGSAFGLFADQTMILTIAAVLGIVVIGLFFFKGAGGSTLLNLSLAMQLSGAIGNIIDRIAYGYVTDFADVSVWPVFNVADSSITIGFLLLAWVVLTGKDKKGRAGDASPS